MKIYHHHLCATFMAGLVCVLATAGCATYHTLHGASIRSEPFGRTLDSKPVRIYTLRNDNGMTACIMTYGGILQSLKVPDRNGKLGDVVLGFDTLPGYLTNSPYFGALVGRYANRIARGRFTLDGVTYQLPISEPPNSLHGGTRGFDKRLWKVVKAKVTRQGPTLELTYLSKNGEEGYPGNLSRIHAVEKKPPMVI